MEKWKNRKKEICKFLIIIGISVVLGLLISVGMAGMTYLQAGENKGKQYVSDINIEVTENVKDGEYYKIPKSGGKIVINTDGAYIHKFSYNYAVAENFIGEVYLLTTNIYGEATVLEIQDASRKQLNRSVINIGKEVSEIKIVFPRTTEGISIDNIMLDNSFKPDPIKALFFMALIFIVLFLVFFRELYVKKIEYAFVVIAMTSGMLLLAAMPAHCVGWDEHIHFLSVYELAAAPGDLGITQAVEFLHYNGESLNRMTNSFEERIDEMRILDEIHERESENIEYSPDMYARFSNFGYFFQSLFIRIALMIRAPFSIVWLAGKFANLLLYVVLFFFAIKKTPYGKHFMLLLGLIPTSIFLAVSYSYDPTVIAGIALGCAIVWDKMVSVDKKISTTEQICYILVMGIAVLPKAVYAPLILLALFIPKEGFKNKRQAKMFHYGCILAFILAMSTFVLPVLISTPMEGDIRGGNTSIGGQLEYILGQPFAYAFVLISNVMGRFLDYSYIEGAISNLSHLGKGEYSVIFFVLLIFVALTDSYGAEKERQTKVLSVKFKVFSAVLIVATVSLVWTALYLSFTEVGATQIVGVQARYFLPLVWLGGMLIPKKQIGNNINIQKYRWLTLAIASGYLLYIIYVLAICGDSFLVDMTIK